LLEGIDASRQHHVPNGLPLRNTEKG